MVAEKYFGSLAKAAAKTRPQPGGAVPRFSTKVKRGTIMKQGDRYESDYAERCASEKRLADLIEFVGMVAKIAAGEIAESPAPSNKVKSGRAGAAARAAKLNKEERSVIAKWAAAGRWG